MRAIFTAKSGSRLAFHVLVACHLTPADSDFAQDLAHRLGTDVGSARYSTNFDKLHVVSGRPSCCGGVLAARQTV